MWNHYLTVSFWFTRGGRWLYIVRTVQMMSIFSVFLIKKGHSAQWSEGHFWLFSILLSSGKEYAFEHYKIHEKQECWNCRVSRQKNELLEVFFYSILSNPLHKMNFLGGARGSKRLISQNPLLKIVSKKYGLMLRTVENKTEIINLSLFVGKKLEFSKHFNFFVILAYELHNKILILEKFDDFCFWLFSVFAKVLVDS